MKGVANFIEVVILISITLACSFAVINVLLSLSKQTVSETSDYSRQMITCGQASFYIENVSFDAAGDCTSGINHTLNITIRNNGHTSLYMKGFSIETSNGSIINFPINSTMNPGSSFRASSVSNISCTDIISQNSTGYVSFLNGVYASSQTCPVSRVMRSEYISILNANQTESSPGMHTMGLWHFNNNLADSSFFGNHGSFSGGTPSYGSGVNTSFGNSLQLDGINDFVFFSNSQSFNITDNITIEVWVKSESDGRYIISKG